MLSLPDSHEYTSGEGVDYLIAKEGLTGGVEISPCRSQIQEKSQINGSDRKSHLQAHQASSRKIAAKRLDNADH